MAEVYIPYEAFQEQREIEEHPARFRVVDCGRRWGKSTFGIKELFDMLRKRLISAGNDTRGWVVAPTYKLVKEDWDIALRLLDSLNPKVHGTDMWIEIQFKEGKVLIEFRSADSDDEGLRGAGLDAVLVDEASRVSKKSWEYGIRPALADRVGRGIFISTPKGRNWFYDIWVKGQHDDTGEWKSWKYPTNTRPSFPPSEWKTIIDTTPENILKQEYLAEFLEDEASVFHNLRSCYRGELEGPVIGEEYVFGVDLARTYDWTVIVGIKKRTKQVVYFSRHKETDWSLQKELIKVVSQRYNRAKIRLDSTGVGDPIEQDLWKAGVPVAGYKFSNTSKQEMVEKLIVSIEQGLIGIPDPEKEPKLQVLIDEVKAFEYEMLPSGRVRYQAPEGLHDDCVIGLGLAVMGLTNLYVKPRIEPVIEKEGTFKQWHNRIKKTRYLHRLPQNKQFSYKQIWEHVNA